jgi:hypothetical protein
MFQRSGFQQVDSSSGRDDAGDFEPHCKFIYAMPAGGHLSVVLEDTEEPAAGDGLGDL